MYVPEYGRPSDLATNQRAYHAYQQPLMQAHAHALAHAHAFACCVCGKPYPSVAYLNQSLSHTNTFLSLREH